MNGITLGAHPQQKEVNGNVFPLIYQGEANGREKTLSWIHANRDILKQELMNHGAILFKGMGLGGAEGFEAALDAADFRNMPYVGGAAPRSRVRGGRILTANESPPSEVIPFHHEMAQVPNPPDYVFFYCETAAEEGGATAIVHSNRVFQRFVDAAPEFARLVEKEGVRYIRVMPPEDDPSSPIGRSWRNTFQVKTREEAEVRMKELGTQWEWLDGDSLRTVTRVVPAIRTDERTGLKVFFNSMVAAYTGWQDSRNEATRAVVCGNGEPVDGEALLTTEVAMDEESVVIPWENGDMLWIDNGLTLHARQPFRGDRRILASIAIR